MPVALAVALEELGVDDPEEDGVAEADSDSVVGVVDERVVLVPVEVEVVESVSVDLLEVEVGVVVLEVLDEVLSAPVTLNCSDCARMPVL